MYLSFYDVSSLCLNAVFNWGLQTAMFYIYLFIFLYGEIILKDRMEAHSKLVWMSRLTNTIHREGMKRLITYIMGLQSDYSIAGFLSWPKKNDSREQGKETACGFYCDQKIGRRSGFLCTVGLAWFDPSPGAKGDGHRPSWLTQIWGKRQKEEE